MLALLGHERGGEKWLVAAGTLHCYLSVGQKKNQSHLLSMALRMCRCRLYQHSVVIQSCCVTRFVTTYTMYIFNAPI